MLPDEHLRTSHICPLLAGNCSRTARSKVPKFARWGTDSNNKPIKPLFLIILSMCAESHILLVPAPLLLVSRKRGSQQSNLHRPEFSDDQHLRTRS
jgi:hypothetical protein